MLGNGGFSRTANSWFFPWHALSTITRHPTPTPSLWVIPTVDPSVTANWKTYAFERANTSVPKFEIKYPPNWDYRAISAGDPLHLYFYTSSIGSLPRQVNDTTPPDDPSLPKPLKAPIQLLVSIGQVDRCPCENLVISGLPAKKIMLKDWEIIEFIKGEYTLSIMRELKDHPYIDNSLSAGKETELFDQILSTFKFTE